MSSDCYVFKFNQSSVCGVLGVWCGGGGGGGGGDGGRDVRPASQDLYPIYDQNLLLCLPFL